MNIYFSGIGGVGIGPLAEIALDAGHTVQGSDPNESLMTKRLAARGVAINNNQNGKFLQAIHGHAPVDWFVYTAAMPADHPELQLAKMLGIKITKRDELLSAIIQKKGLKLIAIAGTHGKTTTTSMLVWTLQQLGIPVSYSVGTTMAFAPSGKYDPASEYFVYECDEFDRNFLHFHPYLSLITSVDYDHPDTYGSPEDYIAAFRQFLEQSDNSVVWQGDANLVGELEHMWKLGDHDIIDVKLPGEHNRRNATLVVKALERLGISGDPIAALNDFPGVDRRFEKLAPNLYTDYGHHPVEVQATLQLARELNDDVVLVYQPHQNLRQHELRTQYTDCFEDARDIYWLPTYLTRENPELAVLTPEELTEDITNHDAVHVADLNDQLWEDIQKARDRGALVLLMGAGSIDSWARAMQATPHHADTLIVYQPDGDIILQQRDDKPEILFPGKVSTFGGSVEPDDSSLRDAAARELHEETNLHFVADDLIFFKLHSLDTDNGERILIAVYVIQINDISTLEIYEGTGYAKVSPNNLNDFPITLHTRSIITEYIHPAYTL